MITLTRVTKQFRFEAAHQLPNHVGQCRNLHGHSYLLEVTMSGLVNQNRGVSSEGMVIDFKDVSDLVKVHIIEVVDHQFLNDIVPQEFHPTTAENLARWFFTRISNYMKNMGWRQQLESIRVWETTTAYAEVIAAR